MCTNPNDMRTFFLFLIFLSLPFSRIAAQRTFSLEPEKTCQQIEGFGASDAWSDLLVRRMSETDRQQAAEWLFSNEKDEQGGARGIGLSVWRFNLGGGSMEQGDSSGISDPFRRADAFMCSDGSIDWNRAGGQQILLREASRYGVENLVLFVNSPPVALTRSGHAYTADCDISNLAPENYDAFTDYLIRVLLHFRDEGIPFTLVSPVNEPQWGWCQADGQEGCPYTNKEIFELVTLLNAKLLQNDLPAQIEITESALLVFLNPGYRFKPDRQNQIRKFFSPKSELYVGDLETIRPDIAGHSYFTVWPVWLMRSVRKRVARVTERHDVGYEMTEYCILFSNREIQGGGRDLGMHTALYISRIIHHDLVYGNARSWQWWLALSPYDYKDGLLYISPEGKDLVASKTLWSLGNYSHFIRPGAERIGVKGKQGRNIYVSAFRDPGDGKMVIVAINRSEKAETIRLKGTGSAAVKSWETSEERSLSFTGEHPLARPLVLAPRSVTTFVTE